MKKLLLAVLPLSLIACQGGYEQAQDDTRALNGVWRGSVSEGGQLESMQVHVLEGLMLSVSQDQQRAHSGELVLDDGELAGIVAMRDELGRRDRDYSVLGYAAEGDIMEADLLSQDGDAAMSLFFDEARSYDGASYRDIAGLYYLDAPDIQISLSIDDGGYIEGFDDAGCGYFGRLSVPDYHKNVYAVSLDVEGCALDGEYSFGIGSLRYSQGWPQLVLPMWFDEQDRVEPWVLDRV